MPKPKKERIKKEEGDWEEKFCNGEPCVCKPMESSPTKKEGWDWETEFEKAFDLMFKGCGVGYGKMQVGLKSFIGHAIDEALVSQKAEMVREIEDMKKKIHEEDSEAWGWDFREKHEIGCCPGDDTAEIYEQALSDIISKIKTSK